MDEIIMDEVKMDEIRIVDLKIRANHGVLKEEKIAGQDFYVNATLFTDISGAGKSDDLFLATDYSKVCETIKEVMTSETYDLIETVAHKVALAILLNYELISEVEVEIRKPHAPVPMEFESISVCIRRGWHDAYISYGSNMGDSKAIIEEAVNKLANHELIRLVKDSTRIVTKPYGGVEQNDFVNGACHIKTILSPEELLSYLHELEAEAHRERIVRWGPRTLDLDIVLYDKLIYESEDLIIPHVDMENRSFVLEPLCELNENMRHPVLQKTMRQLLEGLQ